MQNLSAEARVDQIIQRLDAKLSAPIDLGGTKASLELNASQEMRSTVTQNPGVDFASFARMMQSQMYSEAMRSPDDKDGNTDMMSMIMGGSGGVPGSQAGIMALMQNPGAFDMSRGMMPQQNFPGLNIPAYNAPTELANFPVQGRVSSHYGERVHPLTGETDFHNGVDIAAKAGDAIRSPWEGRVVFVGEAEGFGANTVVIEHRGTMQPDGQVMYSIFGHNKDVYVKYGDEIRKGEVFGTVGSDGHSTGPHLHWETRKAFPGLVGKAIFQDQLSMAIDPLKFV